MLGIQNLLKVVVCALPRMMSAFSKKSLQNIQIQATQSWFRFFCAGPHHSHGQLCSPGDNITCPRVRVTCVSRNSTYTSPCPAQIRCTAPLPQLQAWQRNSKQPNKPGFPYASQSIKKICSCPSTGFHYAGGESLVRN